MPGYEQESCLISCQVGMEQSGHLLPGHPERVTERGYSPSCQIQPGAIHPLQTGIPRSTYSKKCILIQLVSGSEEVPFGSSRSLTAAGQLRVMDRRRYGV